MHLKFEIMHKTLFRIINLIDRFISMVYTTTRKDLQLVGLTAMLVAAKYEAIWDPKVVNISRMAETLYIFFFVTKKFFYVPLILLLGIYTF